MSTTFVFEELDEATRDYLIAVRDAEGLGSPGVFVNTTDSLPGCGCIAGPIVIIATLCATLTTWFNVIFDDPVGVALLQTAGMLVGGWLLVAGFRGGKRSTKVAGTWVYADPLYLYEAFREQVTITPIDEVVEAHYTHNYNNGAYQNSVVNLSMGGRNSYAVTFQNEARAEQMVVYLNYIAWARGTEGGDRANLPPATLGGLAKYVAKNDHEPLDAESNINLNLIELDITEVPEEHTRAGRAMPAIVPYLVMFVLAGLCFLVMAFVVNPPLRDDAIYEAIMKAPEPRMLRAYLVDPRNKAHREQVIERLSQWYDTPIIEVQKNGTDPSLKAGMAEVLKAVRRADQPVVSIRATERGNRDGKAGRETNLRTQVVNDINTAFSQQPLGGPIPPPPDMTWKEPPPPIGQQLLAFIEAPEDAPRVHFDIAYSYEGGDFGGAGTVAATVEIRASIDDAVPVGKSVVTVTGVTAAEMENPTKVSKAIVRAMMGGP